MTVETRGRATEEGSVTPAAPALSFRRDIPLYEYAPAEAVEAIHETSMTLLEEIGIEFRYDSALATWREAGADVAGERVRIPRELLLEKVALAPAEFLQHGRNPERSVVFGGDHVVLSPTYGSPFVRDLAGERRYATLEDFTNFTKLAYMTPSLNHNGGVICEPTDVPIPKRHLEMAYAHLRWSDKPFMGAVTAAERAEDSVEMCRIAFGRDFVHDNAVMTCIINCNSPLVWDETMLAALRVYALSGQSASCSPFIMQGASAPLTTAGALAQLNAEALSAIAYAQILRPGAPMIYGVTPSMVSMRSGAPMYGAAEAMMMGFVGSQLGRRYGLPVRGQGMRTGAKLADAQAGLEGAQSMWPPLISGSHFHIHAAGWLESGLSACFAKFVMDADQLVVLLRMLAGITVDAETLAMDAFREVGPGGQYLGCANTLRHYEHAFFQPPTAFIDTYEQWLEEGGRDTESRARALARDMLDRYEPPPMEPAVDEELKAFVQQRKAELPDENF